MRGNSVIAMRNRRSAAPCPMCRHRITGPAYLVTGIRMKHGHHWKVRELICGSCYRRGITRPPHAHQVNGFQWFKLVGRGAELSPTPCASCGRLVVRNAETLLRWVTCSHTCLTRISSHRDGDSEGSRSCRSCGKPLTTGRCDALYCSAKCRVRAHRRKKAPKQP